MSSHYREAFGKRRPLHGAQEPVNSVVYAYFSISVSSLLNKAAPICQSKGQLREPLNTNYNDRYVRFLFAAFPPLDQSGGFTS